MIERSSVVSGDKVGDWTAQIYNINSTIDPSIVIHVNFTLGFSTSIDRIVFDRFVDWLLICTSVREIVWGSLPLEDTDYYAVLWGPETFLSIPLPTPQNSDSTFDLSLTVEEVSGLSDTNWVEYSLTLATLLI